MNLNKSDFNYVLPEELISQHPIEPRDSAKLLVYNRQDKSITDRVFSDITDYLKKGDVLVINSTKVLPARIYGVKESTGAVCEFLLHKRKSLTEWEALVKPAKRAKINEFFKFSEDLTGKITGEGEEGIRIIEFCFQGVFEDILSKIGTMPLPHYIREKLTDQSKYQTVYAKENGSSAAPTAGLHFTAELLEKVKKMGVEVVEVLLHVGLGTFRPVKTDNILDHKMHSEYFSVKKEAADAVNKALNENRRVIAVGTTSVRVLESAGKSGRLVASCGETNIFIYPPYDFKIVKALITNFHLPESTLIMLVSAFCSREETLKFYEYAVEKQYKFFSFGDATLII